MNNLLESPPLWSLTDGDLSNPECSWDQNGYRKKKNRSSGLKEKDGLPSSGDLYVKSLRGEVEALEPVNPLLRLQP
jgi:hypothetical protein